MGHSHSDGIRSNAMADLATQFKETQCYVALNYDTEPPSQQVIDWAWGEQIELDTIPFQAPELLFRPYLNGIDSLGISEAVFASIEKCDESLEKEMVSNIVLGGGNTMFPGMAERIEADVNSWSDYKAKVAALSDREFSAFIGASQGIQGHWHQMPHSEQFTSKSSWPRLTPPLWSDLWSDPLRKSITDVPSSKQ